MSTAAASMAPDQIHTTAADAATFEVLRGRLVSIAHRILGNRSEAEDIVQEAWLRWQLYDRRPVVNPTAFLVTATTRLAINAAQSARARRESTVGAWLPEPVAISADPTLEVERRDGVEYGLRVLLERLTPAERAAFVLHEAFGHPYARIARLLQTSEVNARQLVSRSRRHLTKGRPREPRRAEHGRLVHAFLAAARRGDVDDLERLLAA
jgi:RNA polymerase sigma-70 factor (ECF subfamily)